MRGPKADTPSSSFREVPKPPIVLQQLPSLLRSWGGVQSSDLRAGCWEQAELLLAFPCADPQDTMEETTKN